MIDCRRLIAAVLAGALAALAVACGGSGSTGLILPEAILLEQVRRQGTCIESQGTAFCATGSGGAVAPGGQRADTVGLLPSPGCAPDACGGAGTATFVVSGFAPGAACAVAARRVADGRWVTGDLVPVGGEPMQLALPLPIDPQDASDAVLLCYERAPSAFPPELASLVDAHPDLVFVPS
jgi:hypothetical protein